ncbi:hypothetical protein [Scytonema sp. NUACC26]|uniref:VMAP-C domain-containing protein n=1 Tax=Scytonema sp. NUACC26 TaxID=3140176 RepID=UPI0034DC52D5
MPYQYLYEDIDNWEITNDRDEPIALLQDFKVVLHSSDRITGVHNYRNLNLGWKRFKEILAKLDKQPNQNIIHQYIESVNENIKRDELTKKLKSKIGIKLTKPLLNNSTDKQEFILTVLGGGVPFAFWIKCKPSRSRKLEKIDCYLTLDYLNNNLQNLIE